MTPLLLPGPTTSWVVSQALSTRVIGLDVHRNNSTRLPGEVCSLNGGLPRCSLTAIVYHQHLLLLDGSTPEVGQMQQLVQLTD
jgi:hypothetical protein